MRPDLAYTGAICALVALLMVLVSVLFELRRDEKAVSKAVMGAFLACTNGRGYTIADRVVFCVVADVQGGQK